MKEHTGISVNYDRLLNQVKAELERGRPRSAGLQLVCDLLRERVATYNWVGFYIADREHQQLVLGPFSGEPTEHVRIPWGRGVCGQAAAQNATMVIPDVSKEQNYLSCSPRVRSEIVIPIRATDGTILGELDIDSHRTNPFTLADRTFLEAVAQEVAADVPIIPREDQT